MTRYATIAAVLTTGILVAACGSSNKAGGSDQAAADTQPTGIALANCIRSHGVPNFPDPTSNGNGGIQIQSSQRSGSGPSTAVNGVAVNGPAFQKAMQACQKYLPNGGHPSAAQTAKAKAAALAFSRCMRSHGVPDFPDPTFQSGPGGNIRVRISGPGIDPSSPAFRSAQQACGSPKGGLPPLPAP